MRSYTKNKNIVFLILIVGSVLLTYFAQGWAQTKPIEGIRENTPQVHALTNARIVQAPGRVIEKGTIVLRDGRIEAVGAQVTPPADARIWDYSGMTIYAGLIESYSHVGLPKEKRMPGQPGQQTPASTPTTSQRKGAEHWNSNVRSEVKVLDNLQPGKDDFKKLRALGFTAALVLPDKGIFSGSGAVVSLGDNPPGEQLLKNNVVQNVNFKSSGDFRSRTYPSSQMGVIALIRQTFLDAQWYQKAHQAYSLNPNGQTRPESNDALAALKMVVGNQQPVLFAVEDDLNFLRAAKVAKEFGLNSWVLGSGYEYRQLDLIKKTGLPVILPVNFPEAPEVETPEEALNVDLMDLSHWDAAPQNPKHLQDAGIQFTLTSANLKKPADFHQRVRQSIERGLPEEAALSALTTTPASLLGLDKQLGTVDSGKLGHLVITNGNLFKEKTKILDVWIDGNRFQVNKKPEFEPAGKWTMTFTIPEADPVKLELALKGEASSLKGSLLKDTTTINMKKVVLNRKRLSMSFPGKDLGFAGVIRMSGAVADKQISGQGEMPDGRWFKWRAEWQESIEPEKSAAKRKPAVAQKPAKAPLSPPGAFGFSQPPEQPKHILVRNATIWTSGPQGKLTNAEMLITRDKITQIGENLKAPSDALIIDAKGKHVTPGIIDSHSHTGLSSINEGTQAITSETRTVDVIDNYDISIYRELAGGLTSLNQLHGSANPIGGQNSIIKLRWGVKKPEDLIIKDAPAGQKFALGENVKRSRSPNNNRYPDTRMGVEQIIRDRLKAAQDYEKEWAKYNTLRNKKTAIPPRRDLELESLLEILQGKRVVHCHAYRQDEMLMIIRVAEDFGFKLSTMDHGLEGYKVAETMAQNGVGVSTFSDWWAYKFEVIDAIPYAAALMHNAGVVVSLKSDSDELARRLNTEAAKAVKYGGISEEEALKFVTLNSAKLLGIDHRTGSLEPGKDADFVVWNGSPLSTYTMCEQTWIDGRKYFDREKDLEMRQQIAAERARIVQKVLASSSKGKTPGKPKGRPAY